MTANPSDLQAIFDRIEAGKRLSKQDLQILVTAVRSQQVAIATGERAVAIGGSADEAVIVTGERNIILTGVNAEAIHLLLRKRSSNEKKLLKAVLEEVKARLSQSLYNEVLIQLGMEAQPNQVRRTWDSDIKIGDSPIEPIPKDWKILQVFNKVQGKLLILGEPGAGKTTTMLELADQLLKQAEQSIDFPIPVIFNLSAWKNEWQSIRDWLIVELKLKYGVRKDVGANLLDNARLLIFLDGLDELESAKQKPCVQAINRLLKSESRPEYLVICSRHEEYEKIIRKQWSEESDFLKEENRLLLSGAIYLKALRDEEIQDYLMRLQRRDLWFVLRQNPILLNFVRTPFWLSILVLSEQEVVYGTWQGLGTIEECFKNLLDAYIRRMLSRTISNPSFKRKKQLSTKQTLHWLTYLATRLREDYDAEFSIEQMQPSWLKEEQVNFIYKPLIRFFLGLSLGLFFAIISCAIVVNYFGILGLGIGTLLGFTLGLIAQFEESIGTVEALRWSWGEFGYRLKIGLNNGLTLGAKLSNLLPIRRINNYYRNIWREIRDYLYQPIQFVWFITCFSFGLAFGIGNGVLQGLIGGLVSSSDIENKVFPNQGIWKSLENLANVCMIWTIGTGLVTGLAASFFVVFPKGLILGAIGACFGMFVGIFAGLETGGKACIQHFILRIILYLEGYIPWNFAYFLDYCTERLFLQRIGGRYRFIHRLLQEYFASMPLDNK
ncbi:MAG: NACHT domain-containing protein [Scytolyngbya sp. HA4215-MV1]|nr:NACHT domain-containing protein [Scytolyngbya sp. HA4215-MV1]